MMTTFNGWCLSFTLLLLILYLLNQWITLIAKQLEICDRDYIWKNYYKMVRSMSLKSQILLSQTRWYKLQNITCKTYCRENLREFVIIILEILAYTMTVFFPFF